MAGGEEGFIVIRRFMIKRLKLQGVPLLLYARIYGFTVGGGAGCYESQRSMAESLGVSERAIGKALRILREKGLVVEVGSHRLRNGRSTKVFRAVNPLKGAGGTICPTGTDFAEQSSEGQRPLPERPRRRPPNRVPPESIEMKNPRERKAEDGFDRYSF